MKELGWMLSCVQVAFITIQTHHMGLYMFLSCLSLQEGSYRQHKHKHKHFTLYTLCYCVTVLLCYYVTQAPTAVHLYLVPAHFKPGLLDALLADLARRVVCVIDCSFVAFFYILPLYIFF